MKLRKLKCRSIQCGSVCFTDEKECPDCGSKNFVVLPMNTLDYVTAWESDLENANRHSISEMPTDLYNIISKLVKDDEMVCKIFQKCAEKGIGI